jgi:hypothetical protein
MRQTCSVMLMLSAIGRSGHAHANVMCDAFDTRDLTISKCQRRKVHIADFCRTVDQLMYEAFWDARLREAPGPRESVCLSSALLSHTVASTSCIPANNYHKNSKPLVLLFAEELEQLVNDPIWSLFRDPMTVSFCNPPRTLSATRCHGSIALILRPRPRGPP